MVALVVVALGIAVPLAIDALAPLRLRATIAGLSTGSRNIQLTRGGQPFDDAFRERTRRRLGDLIDHDYTISYTPLLDGRRETPPLSCNTSSRRLSRGTGFRSFPCAPMATVDSSCAKAQWATRTTRSANCSIPRRSI